VRAARCIAAAIRGRQACCRVAAPEIGQQANPARLIFVWFSNNSRLAVVILVGVVFFFILVIVGVPRRHRGTGEAPPREDAFRHASGHVGLPDGHDIHGQSLTRRRLDD